MKKISLYDIGLSNDEPATKIILAGDTACKALVDTNGDYITVFIGCQPAEFADDIVADGGGRIETLQLKDFNDCKVTTDTEIFGEFPDGKNFSYAPWREEPWYIEGGDC